MPLKHHIRVTDINKHGEVAWSETHSTWRMAYQDLKNSAIQRECQGVKITRDGKGLGGRIQHFHDQCNCNAIVDAL